MALPALPAMDSRTDRRSDRSACHSDKAGRSDCGGVIFLFFLAGAGLCFIKKHGNYRKNLAFRRRVALQKGPSRLLARGGVIDGNITGGRDADIYGHVTGDIILREGTVRILPEGYVNGNITATSIIISGVVEGCCEGHSVSVLAQGRFSGVCRSAAFSITTGGVFTGTSEPWPEKTEPVCLQAGEKAPSADRRDSLVADVRERAETKEEEQ